MSRYHLLYTVVLILNTMVVATAEDDVLNLGIYEKAFAAADPGDITIVMNNLLEQVEISGRKTKATRYRSREAFLSALKSGEVDLAPLESYQYLDFEREVPLDPIVAPVITGDSASRQFILLANKDISFSDVIGSINRHTVALDKRWSGPFAEDWLNQQLAVHGASIGEFKKLTIVDKPSQAVLPVFFKQRDLCVTTADSFELMAELNPQLQQQLHVIATSPPLVLFMLCVPKSVDQSTRTEMTEQLLMLHQREVGQQILLLSKATSMTRITARELATIKELAEFKNTGQTINSRNLTLREEVEQ